LKPLGVFLHNGNMAQHVLDRGGDRGAEGIGQFSETVMDPNSVPARFDQTGGSQICKMP
jgi:hypothetical protein